MKLPESWFDTSDANATPIDIKEGKTLYAKGQKVTGTQKFSVSGNKLICPTDFTVVGNKVVAPASWVKKGE